MLLFRISYISLPGVALPAIKSDAVAQLEFLIKMRLAIPYYVVKTGAGAGAGIKAESRAYLSRQQD